MIGLATLRTTAAVAFGLLISATAHGQLFRSYVKSTGNDANPCNLQAPCRLLRPRSRRWPMAARSGCSIPPTTTAAGQRHQIGDDPGGARGVGQRPRIGGPPSNRHGRGQGGAAQPRHHAIAERGCRAWHPHDGWRRPDRRQLSHRQHASKRHCRDDRRHRADHGHDDPGNTGTGVALGNGARATITRAMVRGNGAQGIFAYITTAATFTSVDIAESTIDTNGAGLLGFIDFGLNAR